MKISGHPKRLAIYFFFDEDGIVDRYVGYFLEDLKKNVSRLLIVSNGMPVEAGKALLQSYGELFVRENTGFDVWAYKEALEHVGWEKLGEYDEVILLNSTIMGPVFPLKETFDKMDQKDVDFWGLTMFFRQNSDPTGCSRYGYIPDHLQSHFIACRKSLVKSREFQQYWAEMPPIRGYWESVGRHEIIFTKYFEDLGFRSAVSVEMEDLRTYSGYPLMMCPVKMAEERRCPIIKRRLFFNDPVDFMMETAGEQSRSLLRYLEEKTSYDTAYIWETVLRKYHQSDVVKALNLNYIFSQTLSDEESYKTAIGENRTALILYLEYEELFEKYAAYAACMPEEADLYVMTDSEKKKEKLRRIFREICGRDLELWVTKGGYAQALLIDAKKIVRQYDLVCFVHDMKSFQSAVVFGWEYRCMESMLGGRDLVKNIISAFYKNPRLGMLAPPFPNHGIYFTNIGKEWRQYYPRVHGLMEELGLKVPMSEDKPPVCPLETIFWFRPRLVTRLYERDWAYEDFDLSDEEELLAFRETIARAWPFVVQAAGYYPAFLMSEKTAETELGTLNYYLRSYNTLLMKHGIENFHPFMCGSLEGLFATEKQLREGLAEKEKELTEKQGHIATLSMQLQELQIEKQRIEGLPLKDILAFWYANRKRRKEK